LASLLGEKRKCGRDCRCGGKAAVTRAMLLWATIDGTLRSPTAPDVTGNDIGPRILTARRDTGGLDVQDVVSPTIRTGESVRALRAWNGAASHPFHERSG
jgi:hypothetical protein